jgi:hypothetical protein
MSAYLLIVLAVLTRVMPHPAWFNFTAVGGSLLFFGARRPLRQAVLPVLALMATDYYLTAFAYNYPFHAQDYLITWVWYAAVVILGRVLLTNRVSVGRVAAGAVLSSTSFFLATNFAAWTALGMYPHNAAGLMMSYAAGLPFYRNDLLSTGLVAGLAFGLPALVRQYRSSHAAVEMHRAA